MQQQENRFSPSEALGSRELFAALLKPEEDPGVPEDFFYISFGVWFQNREGLLGVSKERYAFKKAN